MKNALKKINKLIAKLLRNQIGQQLAKLIKRGPIHQVELDNSLSAKTNKQMQPLDDFFESLVADERTPDEIFLKPRNGDIK